jgi:hypothetical protein
MAHSNPLPNPDRTSPWPLVLCLVGLDYFSTLAYLPSIAVEAAGPLAPIAIGFMVLVTFLFALPVYWYVVGRSPHGHGAIALVEHSCAGWHGKILVLILLGFAAADFVITRSLSVADAATHLIHNPHGQSLLARLSPPDDWLAEWTSPSTTARLRGWVTPQMVITLLLSLMTFVFWWPLRRGVTRGMLAVSAIVVTAYLITTGLVIFSSLSYIVGHPSIWQSWLERVLHAASAAPDQRDGYALAGRWFGVALWCFPQIALGLSGFELIMTTAPNLRGLGPSGEPSIQGRVRNTRKLMMVAALIMAVYMTSAVIVTSLLMPAETLGPGGNAQHRALAYIAHGGELAAGISATEVHPWFSDHFGDVYDLATVAILCLAGASVMMGLRGLVPHYLHRLGMELSWAGRVSVILHVLNGVILLVTVVFHASLSAQQWAYATSVLVLLGGAALAATWDVDHRLQGSRWRLLAASPFAMACGFFLGMTALTMVVNRSGLVIALAFVVSILITSFFSRWLRSTELRFEGFAFADEPSRERWEEICRLPAKILVPHRPGLASLAEKDAALKREFHLDPNTPLIFVEALVDDPSDFFQAPLMKVGVEEGLKVIRLSECVSVSHVLAAVCVEICRVGPPPEMVFGWSAEAPLAANLNFLLLGQGNIPWMVKELVRRAIPAGKQQPRILIG